MSLSLTHFLFLSAVLLGAGVVTILRKRHPLGILLGIELILAAANLNLVAFARYGAAAGRPAVAGQALALFVTVIAVAQAAVALALCWQWRRTKSAPESDTQADVNNSTAPQP